jgi:5-methylcytosine-specific restriction endonuclease McrA
MPKIIVPDLVEADEAIFLLYSGLCAFCERADGGALHEIVPRSKRPKDWWLTENRVPVCATCHDIIHDKGAGQPKTQAKVRENRYRLLWNRRGLSGENADIKFSDIDRAHGLA